MEDASVRFAAARAARLPGRPFHPEGHPQVGAGKDRGCSQGRGKDRGHSQG